MTGHELREERPVAVEDVEAAHQLEADRVQLDVDDGAGSLLVAWDRRAEQLPAGSHSSGVTDRLSPP